MTNPQLLRLGEHLQHLKLFRVQERLETLLQEASAQELTYADFLDRLLTEEVTAKEEKHVTMRTVMARFPIARPWRVSTLAFSPRWIARNCRSWPPAASSSMGTMSSSWARPARGRPIWPSPWA